MLHIIYEYIHQVSLIVIHGMIGIRQTNNCQLLYKLFLIQLEFYISAATI